MFVGEWGGEAGDLAFGRKLAQKMRSLDLGWTAWSWADSPHLVEAPDHRPTPVGALVQQELANAGPDRL